MFHLLYSGCTRQGLQGWTGLRSERGTTKMCENTMEEVDIRIQRTLRLRHWSQDLFSLGACIVSPCVVWIDLGARGLKDWESPAA